MSGDDERPAGGVWTRGRAFVQRNRSRLLRIAVLVAVVYAVTDLVRHNPQDATLSLPIEELREEADPRADEVEISVYEAGSGEALTYTRARLTDDGASVGHAVHLAPGRYGVRVEMRGAAPREGAFEIPADGVVRVSLAIARP